MSLPSISKSEHFKYNVDKYLNMWPIFGLDVISSNYEFYIDITTLDIDLQFYNHNWYLSPNLRVIDFDGPLEFPSNLFPKYKKRSLSFPLKFERRSIYEPTSPLLGT